MKIFSIFFSRLFLKFCVVGASGVIVNAAVLSFCSDILKLHLNISAVIAIFISITTNFLLNNTWTFSDRNNPENSILKKWLQFQAVSLAGALIQWLIFVFCNYLLFILLSAAPDKAQNINRNWIEYWIITPVVNPPDIGYFKYIALMAGIGTATFWNFIINFKWTWHKGETVK